MVVAKSNLYYVIDINTTVFIASKSCFWIHSKQEVGSYIIGSSQLPVLFQRMNFPAIPVHISSMVVDAVTAVLDKTVCEYWTWPFCLYVCT
jgi:hypothetical protein